MFKRQFPPPAGVVTSRTVRGRLTRRSELPKVNVLVTAGAILFERLHPDDFFRGTRISHFVAFRAFGVPMFLLKRKIRKIVIECAAAPRVGRVAGFTPVLFDPFANLPAVRIGVAGTAGLVLELETPDVRCAFFAWRRRLYDFELMAFTARSRKVTAG